MEAMPHGQEYSNDEGVGIIAPQIIFYRQQQSLSLSRQLLLFHMVAVLAGLSPHFEIFDAKGTWALQIAAMIGVLLFALHLHRKFPSTGMFGDAPLLSRPKRTQSDDTNQDKFEQSQTLATDSSFEVPLVPFLPLLGVFLNWYLITQLAWSGILLLVLFLAIISLLYLWCINGSRKQAVVFTNQKARYDPVHSNENVEGPVYSLPKR
jgi:hypothetical protein